MKLIRQLFVNGQLVSWYRLADGRVLQTALR
jgi:hypothetical protein